MSRTRRGDWYRWMVKSCREENARKRVQVCSRPSLHTPTHGPYGHRHFLEPKPDTLLPCYEQTNLLLLAKYDLSSSTGQQHPPAWLFLPLCPWAATLLFHLCDPTQCPPLWHFSPNCLLCIELVTWYLIIYSFTNTRMLQKWSEVGPRACLCPS